MSPADPFEEWARGYCGFCGFVYPVRGAGTKFHDAKREAGEFHFQQKKQLNKARKARSKARKRYESVHHQQWETEERRRSIWRIAASVPCPHEWRHTKGLSAVNKLRMRPRDAGLNEKLTQSAIEMARAQI